MNDDRHDLVTIGVFGHPDEAALAKNRLESIGIKAVLGEENSASLGWVLTGAQGGIRLLVARIDAETAEDFLDDRPWLEPDEAEKTGIATTEPLEKMAPAPDDEESPLSPREKQATRAFKSAVLGMLLAPLLAYSLYLLICVCASDKRLAGRPRRHAWCAGFALAALLLFAVAFVGSLFVPPPVNKVDLRKFPHPDLLVGQWRGKRVDDRGESVIDMDLAADGHLSFRSSGAWELEAAGTWGFDHFTLYVQMERVAKGIDALHGQIGGWEMEKSTRDELLLREEPKILRMVRR